LLADIARTQFDDAWWAPELRAKLCVPQLLAQNWTVHQPSPPAYFDPMAPGPSYDILRGEIGKLLQLVPLRAARQGEILQQAGNLAGVWRQFLGAHGGRRPATAALVYLCLGIGNLIGLHWKRHFRAPRPAQIYPALMPVVATPRHPAYPSNHAFQSHLVHELLGPILLETNPDGTTAPHGIVEPARDLAARIARNREIAGVHFEADSAAGAALAAKLGVAAQPLVAAALAEPASPLPGATGEFGRLVRDIRAEWLGAPTLRDQGAPLSHTGFAAFPTSAEVIANAVAAKLEPPP
jgi:hypothetical protein